MNRDGVLLTIDGDAVPQSLRINREDVLAVLVEQLGQGRKGFHGNVVRILVRKERQVELLAGSDHHLQLGAVVAVAVLVHLQGGVVLFGQVLVDFGHDGFFGVRRGTQGVPLDLIGIELAHVNISEGDGSAADGESQSQNQSQSLFHEKRPP